MRKSGVIYKGSDEIMPLTWAENVLVNKETPLTEVLIEAPQVAEVGQILAVKSVDESGKPVEWEVIKNAAGISDYDELDNLPSINGVTLSGNKSADDLGLLTEEQYKGTYTKPEGGIPKSDLSSAVQTSLGKADTALQSEQYKGTVTSVKVGSTSYSPSNGVVSLPSYPSATSTYSPTGTTAVNGTAVASAISNKVDKDDTGWLTVTKNNTTVVSTVYYRLINKVMYIRGSFTVQSLPSNKTIEVGVLPSGYRPANNYSQYYSVLSSSYVFSVAYRCVVQTNGNISIQYNPNDKPPVKGSTYTVPPMTFLID